MPVVDYKNYCKMLDRALENKFAYPAVNVSNVETANAVLEAFARAKSDGIIQVSIGGGKHASGMVANSAIGAISLANHIHLMAEKYDINIALHTDHCTAANVEPFMKPLIEETKKRRAQGLPNLFNSHMFDGSDIPLEENIKISKELMALCAENEIILEVEAGVVGGEEDGVNNEDVAADKLFTTPEDMLMFEEALKDVGDRYMLAATFGNVHGVYKPGNVKLKPIILKEGQDALKAKYGEDANYYLVFHGGSGSTKEEIEETLEYGVIKMNIDTDTQYAFTRPVVEHMFKHYDEVLKVEGEVGNKKAYDPRAYLKKAQTGMADRVIEACNVLRSSGQTMGRQ
ncbi:class II fructose-bisphosphate aldolase [Vallitalea guaymasensis]|uniref:Fructose-bisphosphate aldolase n=1 Tax=Vallitalea guaymasensis TaxID=1185412 RepID=A0A8J8SAZ3_9FIRM|nr:class II fructose-bisphosphate aldolase [Vallitalea guaymasensis]QUH27806.1 class II fructose-bisphosphate aldolase [Vallitalea guaymasensis]